MVVSWVVSGVNCVDCVVCVVANVDGGVFDVDVNCVKVSVVPDPDVGVPSVFRNDTGVFRDVCTVSDIVVNGMSGVSCDVGNELVASVVVIWSVVCGVSDSGVELGNGVVVPD